MFWRLDAIKRRLKGENNNLIRRNIFTTEHTEITEKMIFLYNILLAAGIAIGFPLIIPLVLTSDKRRKTVLHRLGLSSLPKAISQNKSQKRDSRPIWIHALSVGEVVSAVPLIKELKSCFKHQDIVFSASTKTGFEIASNLLK
jgi:3-deoxy-D-manno-octulosonic-acid transferase